MKRYAMQRNCWNRRSWRGPFSAASCALILTACAPTTDIAGTPPAPPATRLDDGRPAACLIFEPVTWSPADTDETIEAAKEHNAVWTGLCASTQEDRKPDGQ